MIKAAEFPATIPAAAYLKNDKMKHKTEINELIPGIGAISVYFDNKQPLPYFKISIHKAEANIEYFGAKALEYGKQFFEENIIVEDKIYDIETVIAAAESSSSGQIKNLTRHKENKIARYLLGWYCVRYLKCSTTKAGEIIGRDHATVIHGMKLIDKKSKYKS